MDVDGAAVELTAYGEDHAASQHFAAIQKRNRSLTLSQTPAERLTIIEGTPWSAADNDKSMDPARRNAFFPWALQCVQ